MRSKTAGWLGGLLLIASGWSARAQEAAAAAIAPPVVIGNGRDLVTEETVEDMRRMVRAITKDEQAASWWLVSYAGSYPEGQPRHLYRIEVYLQPFVFTARLIRCRSILCLRPEENSWGKGSPVFGNWSSAGARASECALVAPPNQPFTTVAAFRPKEGDGEPFGLVRPERLIDEDVIGVVDAMRRAAPKQRIQHIEALGEDSMKVTGVGRGESNLEIEFARDGTGWKETRRGKWYY